MNCARFRFAGRDFHDRALQIPGRSRSEGRQALRPRLDAAAQIRRGSDLIQESETQEVPGQKSLRCQEKPARPLHTHRGDGPRYPGAVIVNTQRRSRHPDATFRRTNTEIASQREVGSRAIRAVPHRANRRDRQCGKLVARGREWIAPPVNPENVVKLQTGAKHAFTGTFHDDGPDTPGGAETADSVPKLPDFREVESIAFFDSVQNQATNASVHHDLHGAHNWRSTMTGAWSDGRSQPRASRRTRASRMPPRSSEETQMWSRRRPRSESDQSRAL